MKTFIKVIIVTACVFPLLLAAAWCFFAFDLQWAITWQALSLGLPLMAAIVFVTLCTVYFFKRRKWRWGFASIGIAIVTLVYTGLILWNYSYIVVHEPKNNPVVTPDNEENRILTSFLNWNQSHFIPQTFGPRYVVIDPDTSNFFSLYSPHIIESTKTDLIRDYQKRNGENEIISQNIGLLFNRLIELNENPSRLNIKSSLENGYYINYDNQFNNYVNKDFPVYSSKYSKYFHLDFWGWEIWRVHGRDFGGFVYISVPAYDKDTGMVIIEMGNSGGYTAGAGFIFIFKYDNGELKIISAINTWIS